MEYARVDRAFFNKPGAGEAQCEPLTQIQSENSRRKMLSQPNFVEIYQIPKPVTADEEEEREQRRRTRTVDEENSPAEEPMTGEATPYGQGQETTKKEPLPSEIITTHSGLLVPVATFKRLAT